MSDTQTLPVILGASITLTLPDGREFKARPLGLSVLTDTMEKMLEERLRRLGLPTISEVIKLTVGQDAASQSATLRTLADMRQQACHATLDDVLSWMLTNVAKMVDAVRASIVGDEKPTADEIFRALMQDIRSGNTFIDRWLEVGFNENPTQPPSEQSSGV